MSRTRALAVRVGFYFLEKYSTIQMFSLFISFFFCLSSCKSLIWWWVQTSTKGSKMMVYNIKAEAFLVWGYNESACHLHFGLISYGYIFTHNLLNFICLHYMLLVYSVSSSSPFLTLSISQNVHDFPLIKEKPKFMVCFQISETILIANILLSDV